MRQSVFILLMMCIVTVSSKAQNDWDTYPARTIAEITQAHSGDVIKKSDIMISADPFPSKTVVTYTGKHRPTDELTNYFIDLWVQSRNVSPSNKELLVEEYLFTEKGREVWMPVHKLLIPSMEKELKAGDSITIYYFFLGGFNEKSLQEKRIEKKSSKPGPDEQDRDMSKVQWKFVVEEFQQWKASAQQRFAADPHPACALSLAVRAGR